MRSTAVVLLLVAAAAAAQGPVGGPRGAPGGTPPAPAKAPPVPRQAPSAAAQGPVGAPVGAPPAAPANRTAAAAKPAAAVPAVKDLKYPPLHAIRIPDVDTFTLPNGMRVFLLEDHELPLVHGAARIRTGNLFDPPDKVGLATMTGMVLRTGGTHSKTGDELDLELENVAASVESSIDETLGSVSFSCLK